MGLFGYIREAEIRNVTFTSTQQEQSAAMGMEFSGFDHQPPPDPFHFEANMPEFDWNAVRRTTEGYPVLQWQGGE
jgi:hypothetical protein